MPINSYNFIVSKGKVDQVKKATTAKNIAIEDATIALKREVVVTAA